MNETICSLMYAPLLELTNAKLILYHFGASPMTKPSNPFEERIFAAIKELGLSDDFEFYKTTGLAKDEFAMRQVLKDVYQIKSPRYHCTASFMVEGKDKNIGNLLLLWTPPEYQNNGIRVRKFIKLLAEILFYAGLRILAGTASPPDGKPLRKAKDGKDWRIQRGKSGKTRLLEFYEKCGFEGNEDCLYMRRK